MKYLIVATIVFFQATSFAKWKFIGTETVDQGDVEEYYDDVPLGKGNFPRLWILRDYKNGYRDSGGDVYFSEKILYEFSCREREFRLITMTQHADNLGIGKIIYATSSNYQPKWRAIPPDSIAKKWLQIACK